MKPDAGKNLKKLMTIPKVKAMNETCRQAAKARFDRLIKPVGSLARLEEITCLYAAAQGLQEIDIPKSALLIAVGGGAAEKVHLDTLNILANSLGVGVTPIPVTTDISLYPAITKDLSDKAFWQGQEAVRSAAADGVRAIGVGCCGETAVSQGMPVLMGVLLQAVSQGMPVFLDGADTLLAALAAVSLRPTARDYLIAASTTAEPLQNILLTRLGLSTMLDLKLKTPSGQGALLGFSLLSAGIKALNEMDYFGRVHSPLGDL